MKVEITDDALNSIIKEDARDAIIIYAMKDILDSEITAWLKPTKKDKAEDAIVKEAAKVILDYYGGSDE